MQTCERCRKEITSIDAHQFQYACPTCSTWLVSKGYRIDEANKILKDAIKKIEDLGIDIQTSGGEIVSSENFPSLVVNDLFKM